jgi:preprotein translocase subunit SecB
MASEKKRRKSSTVTKARVEGENVPVNYDRIRTVSSVVTLIDVLLTTSRFESVAHPHCLPAEPEAMHYAFVLANATWTHRSSKKQLGVRLEYRLVTTAKLSKKNTQLFTMAFAYDVTFGVPDSFSPADADTMADFAFANGQLNAFPYVRQHVQDNTAKAGWAPLVLPTFRIPASRPATVGAERSGN